MTREQIEQKAKEWCKQYIECNGDCRWCPNERYKDHFIEGAEFALSHQWFSVEDELPPIGGIVFVTLIDHKGKRRYAFGERTEVRLQVYGIISPSPIPPVTHWMPIPPIAEEGGEK